MRRAGGHDEVVVADLAVQKVYDLVLKVDRRGFPEQHSDVLAPNDATNRRGDVAGIENRSCHLVQQRLKEVMVAPIDKRDADGCLTQTEGRVEPAKASAQDHHVRKAA